MFVHYRIPIQSITIFFIKDALLQQFVSICWQYYIILLDRNLTKTVDILSNITTHCYYEYPKQYHYTGSKTLSNNMSLRKNFFKNL